MKTRKKERYEPLYILSRNGWKWLCYEKDKLSNATEFTQYRTEILGSGYTSTVVAIISTLPEHLKVDGHYGVLWLEATYENWKNIRSGCLSYEDMMDMQQAIIYAEENLLRIGMPFTEDYSFHGKNIANKMRRNAKLRKELGLAELEKKDREYK